MPRKRARPLQIGLLSTFMYKLKFQSFDQRDLCIDLTSLVHQVTKNIDRAYVRIHIR